MKKIFQFLLSIMLISTTAYCQNIIEAGDSLKKITLLKNNTYEIREFTKDSLLIYKGVLSSIDPEVRHGKYYFYNNKGNIIVTGLYNQDVPYGIWVYYDESMDTIKVINYTAVWNYLEKDALDYTVDTTVLKTLKKKDKVTMNPDGTFYDVTKRPTYKNTEPSLEFNRYINKTLVYPVYAARKEIKGEFAVQFIIDSNGKIRNPVLKSPAFSDLSIEALRIFSESPTWEPGFQNDIPVNVVYSWSFMFNNFYQFSLNPSTLKKEGDPGSIELVEGDVYYIVEDMPTFNGGDPAIEFVKYIFHNLHYPEEAFSNGISGRVIIQFTINPDGKLINPEVVGSAGPVLDQEAIRVVSSSPLWKPGYQKGKPVNVEFTFPMNFVIEE